MPAVPATVKKILLLCLPCLATAAPFTAFRDGETFTYRVGFAIFTHAGDITIAAHDQKLGGLDVVSVTTDTKSRGIVRGLYAFDNQAEVVIEKSSGRMMRVKESGADPKRATDTEMVFDYKARQAHYTDRVRTERTTDIPIPEGNPVDLISALVQTRDWNLKPGEKRDLLVQFGRDFYPLSIYADSYEEVRTPLGTYRTLLLIPRMEKDPKGLFKKGGEIKVWISQDASNLPVKMQLKLGFGSATLSLSNYKSAPPKNDGSK
ncbi:MAG: DUF3108 domain-containing protein [bacterium]|nr:DUF3108 domain-containing protein [bacterium]MDI1337651.1 DUF3108 domain-containing protein [Lacunisphaera sp.]